MVQSGEESFWGHSVAMSPITTCRQDEISEKYCLEIPPGSLPTSDRGGFRFQKVSWVLLPIILRVPLRQLRETMRWELRLRDDLLREAESKLLQMR
jgi:hypothetical protein